MSNLIPAVLTYDQLADVLADMSERVRSGDSYEGFIQYSFPEDLDTGPDATAVVASYRTGNTMGQGGVRMIGTVPS